MDVLIRVIYSKVKDGIMCVCHSFVASFYLSYIYIYIKSLECIK
jgi:hypothetical protein